MYIISAIVIKQCLSDMSRQKHSTTYSLHIETNSPPLKWMSGAEAERLSAGLTELWLGLELEAAG